jgi:hypothetical protein
MSVRLQNPLRRHTRMVKPISQETNLILQSYFVIALLNALSQDKRLTNSEFYGTLDLSPPIRSGIDQVGVDNQGCALIALYAMLVIPKHFLENKYKVEYEAMNTWLDSVLLDIQSTYTYKESPRDYLRHIRNSVAHARVSFEPNSTITFEDQNKSGSSSFRAKLPLVSLGSLLNNLQTIHIRYAQEMRTDA